jgi:hypothetical protein
MWVAPSGDMLISEDGATFHSHRTGWTHDYGGGASCAGGVGAKKLTVLTQVLGRDGHSWYTVSGSKFSAGPAQANPLRTISTRPAYLGHAYRTVATATLVVRNGHAGCSLTNTVWAASASRRQRLQAVRVSARGLLRGVGAGEY